jgi:hypothetical protein
VATPDPTNVPRSLITMDMELEKKVFESFTSTLKMNELAPDDTPCVVALTMGELRQHVQWCQYAAQQVDQADAANKEFMRIQREGMHAAGQLKHYEGELELLGKAVSVANNMKSQLGKIVGDLNKSIEQRREKDKLHKTLSKYS